MQVMTNSGLEPLDESKINDVIQDACKDLEYVDWAEIATRTRISWYDEITTKELAEATILATTELIEDHPNYEFVAARLLLRKLKKEITFIDFNQYIYETTRILHILDYRLFEYFNLEQLQKAIKYERDQLFRYKGVKILYDKYLLRTDRNFLMEQPQWMWMRIAMGIALGEKENHTEWAIKFYDLISQFDYMPSTPTLFNAGTTHPQLASCYVQDVYDSIEGIFEAYADQGLMSKWAGGIGTNWTKVRATGTKIKGTNGKSTGLIPWLNIQDAIAVAVDQGGKRKGAHCVYIEPWHIDIEDFLDLRKNIGDDRRRTPDLHTALWIPDLFMEAVKNDDDWYLFCPHECPNLANTWGEIFRECYDKYIDDMQYKKVVKAKDLWRQILTALFETGHPWITFKDRCNEANPLQKLGMIRSSNLCTEITLNTAPDETAVCNLGSINLENHTKLVATIAGKEVEILAGVGESVKYKLNTTKLVKTTKLAIRMLDNIIDIMFYPTEKAKITNQANRPIGLGIMGWQHLVYKLEETGDHIYLAAEIQSIIKETALKTSQELADEKGAYPNQMYSNQAFAQRNSYLLAIAPTATISHIVGTSASIEPLFDNLYSDSKLSGEFTNINRFLVDDLMKLGLWNEETKNQIKANNGSIQNISSIPENIRYKYRTAFEISQKELIDIAGVRQKYICQSQSLNLYLSTKSGKELSDLYFYAWEKGLKTTYYLRTKGASSVEKSTVDPNKYGKTHLKTEGNNCRIENGPDCTSCE